MWLAGGLFQGKGLGTTVGCLASSLEVSEEDSAVAAGGTGWGTHALMTSEELSWDNVQFHAIKGSLKSHPV